MADSSRGYAGEPVGPALVGAALVLDPFFSMDPVRFARALRRALSRPKAQEYAAMDMNALKEQVAKFLVSKGIAEDASGGMAAEILLMCNEPDADDAPAEPMAADAAPAAPAADAPAPTQPYSLGALAAVFGITGDVTPERIALAAKASQARIKGLEDQVAKIEKSRADDLKVTREAEFSRNEREGKHLNFARVSGTFARELFDGDYALYTREVGKQPALTASRAPEGTAPTSATSATSAIEVSHESVAAYQAQHPGVTYKAAALAVSKSAKN
jgi:hypothetical protein